MADFVCLNDFTSDDAGKPSSFPSTCAIASGIALKPVSSSATTGRSRVGRLPISRLEVSDSFSVTE
jgi:hypothetical protein